MKNFLRLFRNGLLLFLFSIGAMATHGQTQEVCVTTKCKTSNDLYLAEAYLGYADKYHPDYGKPLPANYVCNGTTDLAIFAKFDGSASSARYSLYYWFRVQVNGVEITDSPFSSCKFPKAAIPKNTPVEIALLPDWECGQEVKLINFFMSWQTASNKDCDCNNNCAFLPEVYVSAPLIASFTTSSLCATGKAFETFTFTNTTAGGKKPYTSIVWDFGDDADPANGNGEEFDVEYSDGGTKTVLLTVTDGDGVIRTASTTIEVMGCCNLSITCPIGSPFSRNTGGNAYYTVSGSEFNPTVTSSNCLNYLLSNNKNAGSTLAGYQLAPGSHTIIWTATATGQTAKNCTITVNVTDNQNPSFTTCPSNKTQDTDNNMCSASVTLTNPVATDNVSVFTLTWVITGDTQATSDATGINYVPSPYTFNKGVSTVTYTAKDAANNSAVCSYTVTVLDKQAPSITACASPVTVNTDQGVCQTAKANVTLGEPSATDNCGGTLTKTNNAPNIFPKGDTNVTWTVTDASGNSSTCIQKVTVVDNQNPTITCPGNIVASTSPEVPDGAIVTYTAPVGTDNCPGAITTQTSGLASGSKFPIGTTTNTFEVTDAEGKKATCSFTVQVNDAQGPVLTCPIPALSYNSDAGECNATLTFTATAIDNDDENPVIVYKVNNQTITFPYDFPIGTTTVTVIATDESNNSSTCSFNVKVEDNEAPSITCIASPPDPIILFELETEYIVDGVEFNPTTYSDNCSAVTLTYSINNGQITGTGSLAGKALPVGEHTIVWTAEDASGNTATCSFNLTIFEGDCVDLSGVCGNTYIVELYPVKVRRTTVYRGYLDTQEIIDDIIINCGYTAENLTITFSQTVFTPNDWGDQNWETITVVDPSGQTYTCQFNVIVRYPLKSGDIYAISAGQPGYDNLDIDVQVFPNPTTGKLQVQIWNLNDPRVTAVVYNTNGAVIMHKEISTTGQVDIDLTGKVSGLYLLRLVADNREFLHKIILESR